LSSNKSSEGCQISQLIIEPEKSAKKSNSNLPTKAQMLSNHFISYGIGKLISLI